jgi:hypothetical protein
LAIPGNFLSATTESVDPNTSGWTAKLNATLSLGTGGRNGDGCLMLTSKASGEMQARTVSSYPVTAGTLYEAFADASAVTVAERIGIRWLSSTGSEVSITWSLTTSSVLSTWHRIAVAGTAPAGATQAQVVLSAMTPAAAGVVHYFENVYLGLPIRTTGNAFGFNAESGEVDASAWTAETNCTVGRIAPAVSWSATWYWAGGQVMTATATGAGNMAMRMVDRPTVTAGAEYLGYIYLSPPTSGSVAWVELRFYDSGGSQIQATRSTLAAPGTGFYRQYVSDFAPAAAASCSLAVGVDSATAGQVLRVETAVVTAAPKLITGTVFPYANSSFEQGTGGWTVTSGVATAARSTPWGTAAYVGNYSLAVSSSTATSSTLRSAITALPAGAGGQNWRGMIIAKLNAGSYTSLTVRVRWYDASNVDLGVSTGTAYSVSGASWGAMQTDAVAPANAAKAALEVVAAASAASSSFWMDAVGLWQVLPQTAVTDHDADGYVTLTLRELTVGQLVTVYRVTADGTQTLVRGPGGLLDKTAIDTDILVVEDHEAPFGVPVYYQIMLWSSATTLASTRTSSTVTLDLADTNLAWLKDPGYPSRNVLLMMQRAPDWQRPIEQSAYVVRGRRNKVVLSGARQGLEGDLALFTRSDEERQALHTLLDSGNVLLWQAAPGMGVADMYVTVGQVTEARTEAAADDPWRVWTLPVIEADMPVTTGVNGAAGRTWQDIAAENATWADVQAKYATWEGVYLNRPK